MAFVAAAAFWCSESHAQMLVHFDLPAQPLARSLKAIGTATNTDVGFSASQVAGLIAPALKADLTVDDALMRVLAGTGLRPRRLGDHTIAIAAADTATSESGGQKASPTNVSAPPMVADQSIAPEDPGRADSTEMPSSAGSKTNDLGEIVVTGTHIHNTEPVTPVITITHDDIVNQGYTTLDQVIEQLPQNFKAGASQESNPISAAGNGASLDYGYASGVNLRGLGANATLVLLNGRRLAPTAYGGVTDISQIPVSVIDRVEILTDGASAIYGSDAVAGVVNVITRRDYSGVELGGRVDSMSEGKTPNYGGNVLGGTSWDGGNVVLDFDYEKDNPLLARNRSFTATLPDPTMLLPKSDKSSLYASLQQRFAEQLTELTLSHGAAGHTAAASLTLDSREVAAGDEIHHAAYGICSVLRGCAIGKDVDMIDDGQRNIRDIVKRPRRPARRNSLPIDQHQRRPSIEPANVDSGAACGVGARLATQHCVLCWSSTKNLRQRPQKILGSSHPRALNLVEAELNRLRPQQRLRAILTRPRNQHLLQSVVITRRMFWTSFQTMPQP